MKEIVESFVVTPEDTGLESLSPSEIEGVFEESQDEIRSLFRRCALAVLAGGAETDDVRELLTEYEDFDLRVVRRPGGISLELSNAPMSAFVSYRDGVGELKYKIIEGARQLENGPPGHARQDAPQGRRPQHAVVDDEDGFDGALGK